MWASIILKIVLFLVLLPGSHFRIPPGGTLHEQAVIHAILFAVLNYIAYKAIRPLLESFDNPDSRVDQPCPEGSIKHRNGDCRMKGEGEAP